MTNFGYQQAKLDLMIGDVGSGATSATVVYTSASLADAAIETGTIALGKGYSISQVETSVAARVRLYVDADSQTADEARVIGVLPTGNHGVILDVVTTVDDLAWFVTPSVLGNNATADVPISVTNLSGGASVVVVTVTELVLEA